MTWRRAWLVLEGRGFEPHLPQMFFDGGLWGLLFGSAPIQKIIRDKSMGSQHALATYVGITTLASSHPLLSTTESSTILPIFGNFGVLGLLPRCRALPTDATPDYHTCN